MAGSTAKAPPMKRGPEQDDFDAVAKLPRLGGPPLAAFPPGGSPFVRPGPMPGGGAGPCGAGPCGGGPCGGGPGGASGADGEGAPAKAEVVSINVEVPRSKVNFIVGNNGATMTAIKSISGAMCTVGPTVPGSDTASINVVGSRAEVERCKGIIGAMIGTLPLMGQGPLGASSSLARPPGGVPPLPINPLLTTVANGIDKGKGMGKGKKGGFLNDTMGALGAFMPRAASNQNDFYNQLMAATQLAANLGEFDGDDGQSEHHSAVKPQDFDRDALRRLAMQAQAKDNETEEAPAWSAQSAGAPPEPEPDYYAPPEPGPSDAGQAARAPSPPAAPLPEEPPEPAPAPAPAPSEWVAAPAAEDAATAASKKDASSVLKFLQGAKDNVARARSGAARGLPIAMQMQIQAAQSAQQASPEAQPPEPPQQQDAPAEGAAGAGAAASVAAAAAAAAAASAAAAAAAGAAGARGGAGASPGSRGTLETVLARLQAGGPAASESRQAAEREVLAALPQLEPARAVDLVVRVHSVEQLRGSMQLLEELCRVLAANVPRFRSPDLARLTETLAAWAKASAGEERMPRLPEAVRSYFGAVSSEITLRLMDVAPADLARTATAVAALGVGSTRLFASIARAVVARADRFAPGELVLLIDAFDQARCFHTSLYEALARCLRHNARHAAPKDIVLGLSSLAASGVKADGLGDAIGDHLPNTAIAKGLFTADEACRLAWAFCALDLHHDKLFRAVFRALEDAPVQASQTLCQLYEIHLTLKAFHYSSYVEYELEDDTAKSLRDHYRRHPLLLKKERSSERLHSDVADLLREVLDASVSTAHVTSPGFTVDVAAMPRGRRSSSSAEPLAILDIDGPHTLIRSLDPLENTVGAAPRIHGSVSLKRRVLQKRGFRLVVFAEETWRGLDGNREKREFLRSALRKAGVSEDRFR